MRFRQARHDDSALAHAGERPSAGMRAGKGEILVDLVRQQPEIVRAAQRGNRLDLRAGKDRARRIVRAVDPQHPGLRRDRAGKRVEIGMEAAFRAQGKRDHSRAAGADDTLVSGINRLADDDLVTRPGEALHRTVEAALGARHDRDVVGCARLPAAPRHPRRDRFPQCRIADRRRISGAAIAHGADHRLDRYGRRLLVGIADRQKDDVLARLLTPPCLDMDVPGSGASAGNAPDERRKTHRAASVNTRRRRRPAAVGR